MHELKIIEIELTFVYELYRRLQASLLFNGEKLRYVEIKAQIFLIWFLILIYGWWPWQVLSISNRLHASAKLHEAVGAQQLWCREHGLGVLPLQSWAGRLGIKCPLQGWHSELVAEDNYCSGPHVFLFFCSAQNAQRKVLSRGKLLEYETVVLFAQLWSAPQRHSVPTSPLKQRYYRLTALQESEESGWWQLSSAHGFQGGGGKGKQQFLALSSSSSAEARQTCRPVWGARNGTPLQSSCAAKLTPTPTYQNSIIPHKLGGETLLEVLLKRKNIYNAQKSYSI